MNQSIYEQLKLNLIKNLFHLFNKRANLEPKFSLNKKESNIKTIFVIPCILVIS